MLMRCLLVMFCALLPSAWAGPSLSFAGRYGHTATASLEDVVWIVEEDGARWRITRTTDDEVALAQRLSAHGRAAFWSRMGWPDATSTGADCLTWGDKPGSLADLLADTPPVPAPSGDDYGHAVLCHLSPEARAGIDWLASNTSAWFYYDPMAGVMEAHRLP